MLNLQKETDKGIEGQQILAKPCPACGNANINITTMLYPFSIQCNVCHFRTGYYEQCEDAINAWNYRPIITSDSSIEKPTFQMDLLGRFEDIESDIKALIFEKGKQQIEQSEDFSSLDEMKLKLEKLVSYKTRLIEYLEKYPSFMKEFVEEFRDEMDEILKTKPLPKKSTVNVNLNMNMCIQNLSHRC